MPEIPYRPGLLVGVILFLLVLLLLAQTIQEWRVVFA